MPNDDLVQALAQPGPGQGPSPGGPPPGSPPPGGAMPPQQAMQLLQQLGITPQNLPMVIQAIQAVMGGGGGGPPPGGGAPNGPPMMAGPGAMPPG